MRTLLPLLALTGCRTLAVEDPACDDTPLTVTTVDRLPMCTTLLDQPGAVQAEAARITAHDGDWADNGISIAAWLPWSTATLRWIAPGTCADDAEQALALAQAEAPSVTLTQAHAAYEVGRWYTFVDGIGRGLRVADCSTVDDHLDPGTFDGTFSVDDPVEVFSFARTLTAFEAIQLGMELEAHRRTDQKATDEVRLTIVAFGADDASVAPTFVSCAAGAVDGDWLLHERRWVYENDGLWLSEQHHDLADCEAG